MKTQKKLYVIVDDKLLYNGIHIWFDFKPVQMHLNTKLWIIKEDLDGCQVHIYKGEKQK